MTRRAVRADGGRLWLGERSVPFVAGEIQFWRMDPASWRGALESAVGLGIPVVSTYLSWRRHEPRRDAFDWGSSDPRLDARRFVALCGELGLHVHLKPGPWIGAEEVSGGYPDWLLDTPGIAALDAAGSPVVGYNPPFRHPVPSPWDARYRQATRRWFAAVWDVLGDARFPDGPIVAVQLDNEPSWCFQDAFGFADYHPEAVAAFRSWLGERYPTADDLRRAWGGAAAPPATVAEAEPPRPPDDDTPRVRDWVEFTGDGLAEHLRFLLQVHDDLGCGALLPTVNIVNHPVHDVPLRERTIVAATGAVAGVDQYYEPPVGWDDVARLALGAATARAAGEPVTWAPEMMAGIWRSPGEHVTYPDPTPTEQTVWWGAAEALGYQAFTAYMLADRENWQYAPIGPGGALSPFARPVADLLARRRSAPELADARPHVDVVVAWHRDAALDAYAATGTAADPEVPWARPGRRRAYDAWVGTLRELVEGGYVYDLWDTAAQPPPPGTAVLLPPGTPRAVEARLVRAGCAPVAVAGAGPAAAMAALGRHPAVGLRTPAGERPPRTLGVLHGAPGRRWVHLVRWGSGGPLEIRPPAPVRAAVDLRTGERLDAVDGVLRLDLEPGHAVLAIE